jgi:hypothetical protein
MPDARIPPHDRALHRAPEVRKAAHGSRARTASATLAYAIPYEAAAFVQQYGSRFQPDNAHQGTATGEMTSPSP